jgi:hypothetical protein
MHVWPLLATHSEAAPDANSNAITKADPIPVTGPEHFALPSSDPPWFDNCKHL